MIMDEILLLVPFSLLLSLTGVMECTSHHNRGETQLLSECGGKPHDTGVYMYVPLLLFRPKEVRLDRSISVRKATNM